MKKILIIFALFATVLASCSKDALETKPTQSVSGDGIMEKTTTALMALDGTYRLIFDWGWPVTGNYHQEVGIMGYALMADLMGEDMVMSQQGNGWFWYDYRYGVKSRYTASTWRPYGLWNFYYTIIANVNYIIAAEETMEGPTADKNNIVGQAYAIRAYCYHNLAVMFARTYVGHENEKCVPIYTEPSSAGTEGQPRSTNEEVYARALADIDKSIALLAEGAAARDKSHISINVAKALKARILSYTAKSASDWKAIANLAKEAQAGGTICAYDNVYNGFNSAEQKFVMWGYYTIQEQTTTNPQFMAHMDYYWGGYGKAAPKCCSAWLYDKIAATDARKAWFNANHDYPLLQEKFLFNTNKDPNDAKYVNSICDRIYMRVEEMHLLEAEALCRAGEDAAAQAVLNNFMKNRDKSYNCTKTGTELGALTTDLTGSLLEEILIQRRIELWGEYGRVYDIKRLKQGFVRTAEMGHPADGISALNSLKCDNPETWDWVMTIPQKEFDANKNMDINTDQNPVGSGI